MGLASMTGFARAEGEGCGISWVWEIKSINGRSLDLRLRLAPGFDPLEPELRGELARRFRRGSFSAGLSVTRTAPAALRVNRRLLAQLMALVDDRFGVVLDDLDNALQRQEPVDARRCRRDRPGQFVD